MYRCEVEANTAAIVCGGEGKRLSLAVNGLPKALIPIQKRPMLEHVIRDLSANGIKNIFLLTRHQHGLITETMLPLVQNVDVHLTSFYADVGKMEHILLFLDTVMTQESFLLLPGDHLFDDGIINALKAVPPRNGLILAVACAQGTRDYGPMSSNCHKVCLNRNNDSIVAIGKDLQMFNAFDTGAYHWSVTLKDRLRIFLQSGPPEKMKLSAFTQVLANEGLARYVNIGMKRWVNINTIQDLNIAERYLAQRKRNRISSN